MVSFGQPPASSGDAPTVRIVTLGHFGVTVDGMPLRVDSSAGRPLELLQCLVAGGGTQVPEPQLTEALWPDSDGDRAHRAFATTLHRLRRLLGGAVLRMQQGRLSLDLGRCWVDALAFGADTDAPSESSNEALEAVLELYQGPFLEGAPEYPAIIAMRDRLRSLYVQRALILGGRFRAQNRHDAATAAYERALAAEPAAESVCQALMEARNSAGRPAEAIATYHRHRRYAAALGAPPTAELEAVLKLALDLRAQDVPRPDAPSLAVLPFAYLGGPKGSRWLADAFTENLSERMARLPRMVVIDVHSSRACAQGTRRIQQIGVELGVRYLLRGAVQAAPNRLRITASLVEARSEAPIWTDHYDVGRKDLLSVQDQILTEILTAMAVKLTEGEQARHLWRGTASDSRAWELAVQGLEQYRRFTVASHAAARRLWSEALRRDPKYVMALVPLGWTHVSDVRRDRTDRPAQALARAEGFARRALAVDPQSGPAHVMLGHIRLLQQRQDEARLLLLQGAELNPHGADTAVIVGSGLSYCGEPEAGERWVRRAMELSPFYPEWYLGPLGCARYLAGDFAGALRTLQRSRVVQGGESGLALTAACQMALGQVANARETVGRLRQVNPRFTVRRRLRWIFPVRDSALRDEIRARLRGAGCP